ncbi:putative quinol monooxygenase [Hirschia maritima]|uniref:putative quinol monooxygenase n=1 Tax=Hirschia maritima TaxID=1121961 RepID=UPI00037A7C5D|nr:antibiotic biosynthesis monooxygenase [Hirschia maritima]
MLLLEGWLRLPPNALSENKELFVEFVKACNTEQGCLEFSFSIDVANPDVLNLRERFVDEAAFEQHQQAKHTIEFKEKLYALGGVERDVRFYRNVEPVQR